MTSDDAYWTQEINAPSLISQLDHAGISWKAYLQALPYPGYQGHLLSGQVQRGAGQRSAVRVQARRHPELHHVAQPGRLVAPGADRPAGRRPAQRRRAPVQLSGPGRMPRHARRPAVLPGQRQHQGPAEPAPGRGGRRLPRPAGQQDHPRRVLGQGQQRHRHHLRQRGQQRGLLRRQAGRRPDRHRGGHQPRPARGARRPPRQPLLAAEHHPARLRPGLPGAHLRHPARAAAGQAVRGDRLGCYRHPGAAGTALADAHADATGTAGADPVDGQCGRLDRAAGRLLGGNDNSLGVIAGSSARDIWAFGDFLPDAKGSNQDATLTFAEHYNGVRWTAV